MKKETDLQQRVSTLSLNIALTIIVFLTLCAALLISVLVVMLLVRLGVINTAVTEAGTGTKQIVAFLCLFSLIIGTGITAAISRFPIKPVDRLVTKLRLLASGNYSTRICRRKPYGGLPPVRAIEDSFNILAEELEHTEMLRSDFINSFSHEFKTPISSIAGFANLARSGDLTDAQRNAYLEIIEAESRRLAQLATNIMHLTRVENQSILTEKTIFNLSEQIRACFILLEDKWSRKAQDFQLEFDEHTITANEELLKHVWMNLMDNAIKFAPTDGVITVTIEETADRISVCVSNTGSEIPPEAQKRIFNKFYQADESHASAGNGIGLSVVKRVVELHGGEIEVQSGHGVTSFTVILPK